MRPHDPGVGASADNPQHQEGIIEQVRCHYRLRQILLPT